jgi:nitrate reductase gamma subunit
MHLGLFGGFLALFFVGSLGDWLTDRGLWAVRKDTPWFALINELSGLLLLAGGGGTLVRRYALPQEVRMARGWKDSLPTVWLAALVATGYLAEGARLAAGGSPVGRGFSFLGGATAALWQAVGLTSAASFQAVWWLHAILGLGFVAYLPYSPVFHLFTAPLSVLFNSPRPRDHGTTGPRDHGTTDPDSGVSGPVVSGQWSPGEGTALAGMVQRVQMDSCTRCRECVRWCEAFFARPDASTSASCRVRKYQSWMKSEALPGRLARLIDG